jgi:RNA polymerase sigma-70 factor (ECF subfamily)
MMNLPDRVLVERIRTHDAAAFEVFFAHHRQKVRRHLMRMLRHEETVEDLTQETFLRVWTRADQWDGRGECRAWLLRIATNLALNLLRAQRRRREVPLEVPPNLLTDDDEGMLPGWMIDAVSPGPEVLCEQSERFALLRRLVERLPEEKREVIHLVHEAEMGIHEVAEQLGIPEGTVKSRLYYAKKHLAREISEWEE